jgi:hypothetical protein
MSTLETLTTTEDTGPGWQECHAAYALRVLPARDADLLRRAMARPKRDVGHKEIATALWTDHGLRVDRQSIGRHRNGDCRCAR